MHRRKLLATVLVSVAVLTSGAEAYVVDPCLSEASVSCPGVRLCICPSNDFENIRDACDGGYIEVWVIEYPTGKGIPGVPTTDYWINACDPAQELCLVLPQFVVADSITSGLPGFEGRTTISGTIAGGGCVLTGGLWLAVQGAVILEPGCIDPACLDIVVVSPDLNGSCTVTLADFQLFGLSYNRSEGMPGFNSCCDFNDDGNCGLSDFAFFAEHYLH